MENIGKYTDISFRADNNHKAIKEADLIAIHAKGLEPTELLEMVRPNEKSQYKEYRIQRWQSVTKTYWSKIQTVIQKIQFSEDFKIKYKEETLTDLQGYLSKEYPKFGSFENWFWSLGYQQFLEDSNGVYICLSEYKQKSDSDLLRPEISFIPYKQILDFKDEQYLVYESKEKSLVRYGNTERKDGRVIIAIDTVNYYRYEQVGKLTDYNFQLVEMFEHNAGGDLPCWKSGGNVKGFEKGNVIYESFLADTLPFFNEAVSIYSDHQANMALHIHPDRWEIASSPCLVCEGRGYNIDAKTNKKHSCNNCGGSGKVVMRTPFNVMQIQPASREGVNDITQIPTPPAGYITRPQENIDFVYGQYKEAIKQALASVNMEFLMNIPMSESGISKLVDRQELNTFLLKITRHIVENIWKNGFYFIAKIRYGNIIKDVNEIIPFVQIPNQFDILTSEIMAQRVGYAIEKKMPSAIIAKLSEEYAESEFGSDDIETLKLKLSNLLDPLPFKNEDEKMSILTNGGCTKSDYIISANIYQFITKAIEDEFTEPFEDMDYKTQMTILKEYAKEVETATKTNMTPLFDEE